MPTTRYKIAKHFLYCLLAVFLFVLQVTPGLFSIGGVRPMLLVGYAVAIAFQEGEIVGGVYGIVCGFLCDLYGYDVLWFYALMLFSICVLTGALVKSYIRPSAVNAAIMTLAAELMIQLVSCLFQLVIWNYAGAGMMLWRHSLPLSIYTAVAALPLFALVRALHGFFARRMEV